MKRNVLLLILIAAGYAMTVSSQTADNRRGGGKNAQAADGNNGGSKSAKTVPDVIETVNRFVPQPTGAEILFNSKAHALIVKNTRENLQLTEDIIAALDVRPVQVLIEARFMDVSVSDLRELGVDWILNSDLSLSPGHSAKILGSTTTTGTGDTSGNTTVNKTSITTANGAPANSGQGLNLTYQGVLGDAQFQAVLHALQESGKAKTLSVPRVTTLNNQTATLFIGDDFLFFENFQLYQYQLTTPPYAVVSALVPDGGPSTVPLGYTLVVTPSVGADLGTINLKLSPKITSVKDKSEWLSYSIPPANNAVSIPEFTRKSLETEVVVRSGETVVMGGLAQTTHSKNETGIPLLSSLPWIGQLFRSNTDIDNVDNWIIFVTATIIADTGEQLVPLDASELPGLPISSAAGGK